MSNVQNQQTGDCGKNVNSLMKIDQANQSLKAWEMIGYEPWLASTVEELNKWHTELREDVRENANSWSNSQYCERLARHYYHLACYCYNELFNKYQVNLESVKKYLQSCLETLTKVSQDDFNEIKKLKSDAENFLAKVNEIYTQKEMQLTQCITSDMKKYIELCSVLGHVNHIPLQQCSGKVIRQRIQNIQLLQVINMLEDAITISEYKNTFITVVQYEYLGQAYQLAGKSELGMLCKETSENLKKTMYATEKHSDTRQVIKDIIRKEIAEHKTDLAHVKINIEEKFHKSLSIIDDAYIGKKYIKYCAMFWLQEITNFLETLTESKSCTVIQEIFNSLDHIQDLSQIPNPLNNLEYYTCLMKHYKLIRKEDENMLVGQFKKYCLEHTLAYSDSAKKELVLLETLDNFLSFSKDRRLIIDELQLENFCRGDLSFAELINSIMNLKVNNYGENLSVLQEAAEGLQEKDDLFLIDKFTEVIDAYIKPVKIQNRRIDDGWVVEVTGKNIVVSDILKKLEPKLVLNKDIEEIRFVAGYILHIDTNLNCDVWHGKNVVIFTKIIKVHDQVTWNVSGEDSDHVYSDNAATDVDGHGKQGKDGLPGESGGNVLVLVEKIENPEKFAIISNGGNGSKGQDGGDGKDGEDGKGITKTEFDEKFPPVAEFGLIGRDLGIKQTVTNIKKDSQVIISEWYNKCGIINDVTHNENVIEEILHDTRSPWVSGGFGNIFINAMTYKGNEITFSFNRHSFATNCQAFLLYKGSLGQPGGRGGEYGLGGQGGYAGNIIIGNATNSKQGFGIIKNAKQGKEGENGQGGLYGKHGENGWDMAYMDYSVSNLFLQELTWPHFPTTGENSKIDLKYYRENSPRRVLCPYREYKGMRDKYVEMKDCFIEHKKQKKYDERISTRQDSKRQYHAQATRKKNISQNKIKATYCNHFSFIEKNIVQDLGSKLENITQQVLQAITENREQQKKQTTELRIKSNSPYQNKSKYCSGIFTKVSSNTYKETIDVKSLIDTLVKEPSQLDKWFQLQKTELHLSQLNQLFLVFNDLKGNFTYTRSLQSNTENTKLQDIEKLLLDKYNLATLQEIAKQLPPYHKVTDNVELTPESAARYLIEAKKNDNNISHSILGSLNQYLYENGKIQRENIAKFCKEELQNKDNEILKSSLREFVSEVENSQEDVKKYHDKYQYFLEKQKRGFIVFPESFEKLEEDCCRNKNVLTEHAKYLEEKGPSVRSYRELLAYIFDTNIRLYIEEEDNKVLLQNTHNPASKNSIHVLYKPNNFIQLKVDENYLRLEKEREMKNNLYTHIFVEVDALKQKQEFDDYLMEKTFLPDNNLLEAEKLNRYFDDGYSLNDEEDIRKIIEYFPEGEKQLVKERLEKITYRYIGHQGILHNMLKRFSADGRHVSSKELCCLVKSIINFIIEDRKEINIFCWIVAAYPQKSWIDELVLLQIEDYFKKQLSAQKSKWREYLSKVENKNILVLLQMKLNQHKSSIPISIQCIDDTLRLLSNIPNETVSLEGLEISEWSYALKEKYWTCKLATLVDWQKGDLSTATYYLLSIENIFGIILVEKLIESLEKKKELSYNTLINILSNFHNEEWNLSENELNILNGCSIDNWAEKMQQKFTANKEERKISQLVEIIMSNANTSKEILNKLPKIKNYILSMDEYEIAGKPVSSFTIDDIENWVRKFQSSIGEKKQSIQETHIEMLVVIDKAIQLKRRFKLRDTQKLTVMAAMANNRGTLVQVSPGEGKSLSIVAASIMKALHREKVHILTSSPVLAKRDARDNIDLYNLFGINVSHNCSEDIEKRKEAYSGNQVVYGDLSNFQRDYLLDTFYGTNILGDFKFENVNVIIDEEDSMLLDKVNNMLYLSHDLAGLDKLESVYLYIWQWINRPTKDREDVYYAFDTKAIKEAVLNDLYGLIKTEDMGKLSLELDGQQKAIIWGRLIKADILDGQGKLLKENIKDIELNKVLSPEFNCYKDRIHYLLKETIEREKIIHVPNNLRPFIEQHLESWIDSAITAFYMKAGEDYVVDVDKTGSSSDLNPNIIILDRDTGTDQANSQWEEALHQFLQLKHGCKLSMQSLKAVFISNVSFFKLYKRNLFGLTGTLGTQRERNLLQEIYEVYFVTVPTAKSKKFHEEPPILCIDKEEWIKRICGEAKKMTEEKKRSVLIICETVNDVEILYKAFGGKNEKHVSTYTRDYEEFDKGFATVQGKKELGQRQIIIATNLAGRGTDIKITEGLGKAGGLHVCLTYLANNIRVEQQAFGRAARSGDTGSGQLIIIDSKGQGYSNSKVLDLKKERDIKELHRISDT